ncbi:MAG: lysoplasmalogenase [Bacteroidota bacterium]|nr:lysoplasmalogenase [Bacteroidota bacterium]
MWLKKNGLYVLLAISVILAILGVATSNFIFKSGTASMGIIIILVLNRQLKNSAKDTWWIFAAFLFSIVGDWFLSNMNGNSLMFIKGIALFFLAHVGYLLYALFNGHIKVVFTGILLVAYLAFFFLVLYPNFTDVPLMVASLVYLLISCFSLGAAVGMRDDPTAKQSFILGISLIIFSDTIIAFKEFVDYHTFDFLITPTYYLAHIFITFSLIKRFESNVPNPN